MKNKLVILLIVIIVLVIVGILVTLRNSIPRPVPNFRPSSDSNIDYIEYKPKDEAYTIKTSDMSNKSFTDGVEVAPSKIYLTSKSFDDLGGNPIYTKLDGSTVNIQKEICFDDSEERIEYDSDLTIYRNTFRVDFAGMTIVHEDEQNGHVEVEDLQALFRGYFSINNGEYVYRTFRTDFDNDPSTNEISFVSYKNGTINRYFAQEKMLTDKTIITISAPVYIGKAIPGKTGMYFIDKTYSNYSLEEIIENCNIPLGYFRLDNHDGFIEEHKLVDGTTNVADSLNVFSGLIFSLSKDINYKPYPIDATYNESSGDKISYYFTRGTSEDALKKGTKFVVDKVLDEYGNAVIRTEDGTLYLLGNN